MLKISAEELRSRVSALHIADDGDGIEKSYWPAINVGFPNYERFWQHVVVAATNRIEKPSNAVNRIDRRSGVSEDVWRVSFINYSVFLNLVGAFEHLSQPLLLSLGNFYTHLASACDLAEEFLMRVQLLMSESRGEPVPELAADSKEEFLEKLGNWYDAEYTRAYELYHRRGKDMLVRIGPRDRILVKYCERRCTAWKEYRRFSGPIREFRNRVVHDVQIGTIQVGKIHLIPRIDRIHEYADLAAIRSAVSNPEKLQRDFVVREEQMFSDFRAFKDRLNDLWETPIADLCVLLYQERNRILLAKYNIELT